MFTRSKDSISIYIGEQFVKIAQVSASGVVHKIARRDIAQGTDDSVVKSLKAALSGFNTRGQALYIVPSSIATAKNIEIPSTDPQEIHSIINLQATRHTPYSRDEILIGYINVGSYQANYTRILLVIVNRAVVKEKLALLEKAGLEPERVLFAPEGIARFYAKALNIKKESAPVGIIDVGASSTSFVLEARGVAVATRSLPIGLKDLSLPDGAEKLVSEIKTSIDAFKGEEIGESPVSFILTADQPELKAVEDKLKEILKAEVSTKSYLDAAKATGLKKKIQKEYPQESFLDVIAPAVVLSRNEVNLLPDDIKLKKTFEQQSQEVTQTAIFFFVLLALLSGILFSKMYFKQAFLNKNLKAKYAAQREEVRTLETQVERNNIVKGVLNSRLAGLDAMNELYSIVPHDIYLSSLAMDETGLITMQGISESPARAYSLMSSIEESELFSDAQTTTSPKKEGGKDVTSFEMNFKLEEAESDNSVSDQEDDENAGTVSE